MARLRDSLSAAKCSEDLSKRLNEWMADFRLQDMFRTCAGCNNLVAPCQCKKAGNTTIPAHVVLTGCELYEDDEDIPF